MFQIFLQLGLIFSLMNTAAAANTLRIATEGSFPPFSYYKGNSLEGFEVDLANEIAKKIGVKSEWKTYSFDSLLIGLNQNRYDLVIASHAVTPERAKAVDFTTPYYCSGGVIVSRLGGPKTAKDLNGKVVATQVGTTYAGIVKKTAQVKEVKTYPKDPDSLQALLGKKIDAIIMDKFAAIDVIKTHKSAGLQMGDVLQEERIALAVAKGNTELKEKVGKALGELMKDGTYSKLSAKYFGQDIRCVQ